MFEALKERRETGSAANCDYTQATIACDGVAPKRLLTTWRIRHVGELSAVFVVVFYIHIGT